MMRTTSVAWLLAAAVCMSSCGGDDGSDLKPIVSTETAPDGLSYPDPNTFTQGVPITPLVPTVRGNPTWWLVIPDLPEGLSISGSGVVSGTPTERRAPAKYQVMAGNTAGTTLFDLRIGIDGRYKIGGFVFGLTGTGLTLTNNGGDPLVVSENGAFVFSQVVTPGAAYSVAVATQPTGQTCSVADGSGNVTNVDVGTVNVTCGNTVPKASRVVSAAAGGPTFAIDGLGRVLHLACFAPPEPGSIRGYVVDPMTGLIMLKGELLDEFRSARPAPARCKTSSITLDPGGDWLYVTNATTQTISLYSTERVISPTH